MKLNLKVRMKNPWFWVGVAGAILTAMGIGPETFTSWGALWNSVLGLLQNPFMLGSVALTVLGIFVDPTTEGVSDSEQAMTYVKPKKKE